jgi:hypothetical protein
VREQRLLVAIAEGQGVEISLCDVHAGYPYDPFAPEHVFVGSKAPWFENDLPYAESAPPG